MNRTTTNNGFRQASQESGIGVPSYRRNRGYKPLPQEIHPSKNRGYKPLLQKITIPFPEEIRVEVGVSSSTPLIFIVKQQKPGNLYASQKRFGCMLFKCVFMGKGSEFACHTPVSDAKITGFGV